MNIFVVKKHLNVDSLAESKIYYNLLEYLFISDLWRGEWHFWIMPIKNYRIKMCLLDLITIKEIDHKF